MIALPQLLKAVKILKEKTDIKDKDDIKELPYEIKLPNELNFIIYLLVLSSLTSFNFNIFLDVIFLIGNLLYISLYLYLIFVKLYVLL